MNIDEMMTGLATEYFVVLDVIGRLVSPNYVERQCHVALYLNMDDKPEYVFTAPTFSQAIEKAYKKCIGE